MRAIKITLNVVLLLLLVVVIIMIWSGFFKQVKVREIEAGPYSMIYLHHNGGYQHSYELADSVTRVLEKNNIPVNNKFVIYYDNPQHKDKKNLESDAGCIVPPGEYNMDNLPSGFQYCRFSSTKSMMISFPHKNRLSVYAGIIKAYSKFNDYQEGHGYSESYSLELYDKENDKILFMMPIEKDK